MRDLHTLDKYRLTDYEKSVYGCRGDGKNGAFKVYVGGRSFFVIASHGGGSPKWARVAATASLINSEANMLLSLRNAEHIHAPAHACRTYWA